MKSKSTLVDGFFRPPAPRKMDKRTRTLYILLGVVAFALLIAAGLGVPAVLCQVGITVGICGMAIIGMAAGLKNEKQAYLMRGGILKDIGVCVVWVLLLIYWINNP